MANDSGSSGFSGVLIGALLVAILVVGGFFLFNGGFGDRGTDINVQVPEVSTPG